MMAVPRLLETTRVLRPRLRLLFVHDSTNPLPGLALGRPQTQTQDMRDAL